MNARLTIYITWFLSMTVFSQTPELVVDLMLGSFSGVEYSNNQDAYVNDGFAFVGTTNTYGTELYLLKNDEIELIKDFAPGPSHSEIEIRLMFNDELYFVVNEYNLWKTDGTTEGTILLYNNVRIGELLVTDVDEMYCNLGSKLFRIDGNNVIEIEGLEVSLATSISGGKNYCKYQNGLAYGISSSGFDALSFSGEVQIWSILDGAVAKIGDYIIEENYCDYLLSNMHQYDDGLFFSMTKKYEDSSCDINEIKFDDGLYRLNVEEASIELMKKGMVGFSEGINLDESIIVVDDSLFLFSSQFLEGNSFSNQTFEPNVAEEYNVEAHEWMNRFILFNSMDGGIQLYDIDIEDDSLNVDYLFENSNLDLLSIKDSLVYYWTGTMSVGALALSVYNLNDNSTSEIFVWNNNTNTPTGPLSAFCVLGNRYYFSYETSDLGREVYGVEIGQVTSVKETLNSNQLNLIHMGSGAYRIEAQNGQRFRVELYDFSGRKITTKELANDQVFVLDMNSLIQFAIVYNDMNQWKAFKIFSF